MKKCFTLEVYLYCWQLGVGCEIFLDVILIYIISYVILFLICRETRSKTMYLSSTSINLHIYYMKAMNLYLLIKHNSSATCHHIIWFHNGFPSQFSQCHVDIDCTEMLLKPKIKSISYILPIYYIYLKLHTFQHNTIVF